MTSTIVCKHTVIIYIFFFFFPSFFIPFHYPSTKYQVSIFKEANLFVFSTLNYYYYSFRRVPLLALEPNKLSAPSGKMEILRSWSQNIGILGAPEGYGTSGDEVWKLAIPDRRMSDWCYGPPQIMGCCCPLCRPPSSDATGRNNTLLLHLFCFSNM